jgi:Mrp family chromosome partitioning ATPase
VRRAESEDATIDFEPDGAHLAAPEPARPRSTAMVPAGGKSMAMVRIPMPSLMLPGAAQKVQIREREVQIREREVQIREPVLEVPPGAELMVPGTMIVVRGVKLADPKPAALAFLDDAGSPRADAYRSLRRKLAASGNPRVVGVTSAGRAEGKTTLACNLALALRESARGRVLLVEANHRAPSLAKLLGFPPPKCFLDQLARHVDDPDAPWIAAEPLPRWHVMAIDAAPNRAPLLDPVAFAAGIAQLKKADYEYIVVDSPPVLGGADGNVIADVVETTIFAALPMRSKRREMRRAVEQLEPAPVLGVVVLEA